MAFLLMSPYLIHRRHSHIDCSETAEYKTGSIILLPKPLELSPSFDLSRAGNSFKHFKWSTGCTPTSLHNTHTHTHAHTYIHTLSLSHWHSHWHSHRAECKADFCLSFPLEYRKGRDPQYSNSSFSRKCHISWLFHLYNPSLLVSGNAK